MDSNDLNKLLKLNDLGDDFLEDKNRLFDTEFSNIKDSDSNKSSVFANNRMAWYFNHPQKYYLLADCNRFHFMWLGHKQEWFTQQGISNPPIGRAYGYWVGENHNWAWEVVRGELVFWNWGERIMPSEIKYDGKGSVAV